VIIGYRTTILMGVEIGENCVVGANSTVTRSILQKGIYGGTPAKFIKEITPLNEADQIKKTEEIIDNYRKIAEYHDLKPEIEINFPVVRIDDFEVNFLTMEYSGEETIVTDDFRDYVRKWGIRIYTRRPFISNFTFD
ncbi:MAG: hypothetical protein DRI97_11325, partial [Bacteroidetes bacterium]